MVVMLPINQLKNSENPIKPLTKREYDLLKESIREVGILHPLLVKKEGPNYVIKNGNHRYMIAKELGIRELPCIVVDDPLKELGAIYDANICVRELSEDEKKKYMEKKQKELDKKIESLPEYIKEIVLSRRISLHDAFRLKDVPPVESNEIIKQIQKELESTRKKLSELTEKYNTLKTRYQEKIESAINEKLHSSEEIQRIYDEIESQYRENIESLLKKKNELEAKITEYEEKLKLISSDNQLIIEKLKADNDRLSKIIKHTVSTEAVIHIFESVVYYLNSINNILLIMPEESLKDIKTDIEKKIETVNKLTKNIMDVLNTRKSKKEAVI